MHRKRHEHLLFGETVRATSAMRRDRECADDASVLLDRRGHRGFQSFAGKNGEPVWVVLVVLDDHEATLSERATCRAIGGPDAQHGGFHGLRVAASGDPDEMRRIREVVHPDIHRLIADELHCGCDDGVENVLERRALRQRTLNAGELIEQRVAVAQHLAQPRGLHVVAHGSRPSALTRQQLQPGLGVDDRRGDHGRRAPVLIAERRPRATLEAQGAVSTRQQAPRRHHDARAQKRRGCGVRRLQVVVRTPVRARTLVRMQGHDRLSVAQQCRNLEVECIDRQLEHTGDRGRVLIRAERPTEIAPVRRHDGSGRAHARRGRA
jgi:hypothetical protein